ncbi:hypothetical protein GCM10028796_58390 [Ramlibacter monticola]
MLPTTASENTAIQAPSSRGTEPSAAWTLTNTASCAANRFVISFRGCMLYKESNGKEPQAFVTKVIIDRRRSVVISTCTPPACLLRREPP